jgi:carboxymethylenebutenolidase
VYDAVQAETISIRGHEGDQISGYLARPLGPGPYPAVVVIHHRPGYDEATKAITRGFAARGYLALCPNLHHREGPDDSPDDAAAVIRAAGGAPDDRVVGDLDGALATLRALTNASGKVGLIGYCSGGRQAYLAGARLDVDAIVACYGGNIVVKSDAELTERMPVAPIDLTPDLRAPVLALFGAQDKNPGPDAVERIRAELDKHGKTHEIEVYEDAGHGFFAADRDSYRPRAAMAGWQRVWDFFGRYLGDGAA